MKTTNLLLFSSLGFLIFFSSCDKEDKKGQITNQYRDVEITLFRAGTTIVSNGREVVTLTVPTEYAQYEKADWDKINVTDYGVTNIEKETSVTSI